MNARNQAEKADVERTNKKQIWFQKAPNAYYARSAESGEPAKIIVPQKYCTTAVLRAAKQVKRNRQK